MDNKSKKKTKPFYKVTLLFYEVDKYGKFLSFEEMKFFAEGRKCFHLQQVERKETITGTFEIKLTEYYIYFHVGNFYALEIRLSPDDLHLVIKKEYLPREDVLKEALERIKKESSGKEYTR